MDQAPFPTTIRSSLTAVRAAALALAFALLLASPARAQPAPQAPQTPTPAPDDVAGEALTVSLVTFGPGDHPFFKFGHNAILIEHRNGQGAVYNFGMFDFSSPALLPKFILGRSHYWLGRTERDRTFAQYVEDDRTVEIDRLEMPAAARAALLRRLDDNARPQNREYLYDYFTDNCSTRVRDALDVAVGGRLRAAGTAAPARLSYRGHALRLVQDLAWEYVALFYALGLPADLRASRWEESFVPMELRDLVRTLRVPAADGSAGDRPLSQSQRVLYRSTRPDPPVEPPRRLSIFLGVGLVIGGVCAALGVLGRRMRIARVILAMLSAVLGLLAGLGGLLLIFLWAATNHRACHANANILQSAPWTIALVVTAFGVGRGDQRWIRRGFRLTAAAGGLSLLGLLARITGLVAQDTDPFIVFFLPIWTGLAFAFWTLLRGDGPSRSDHRVSA